jgi:hypothetical protein
MATKMSKSPALRDAAAASHEKAEDSKAAAAKELGKSTSGKPSADAGKKSGTTSKKNGTRKSR